MTTTGWVVLAVVVLLVLLAVAAVAAARRRRRTAELQGTFGSEYDRTVQGAGGRRQAERELADRQERYRALELRPLSASSRERYQSTWVGVQTRFVDDPDAALGEADGVVSRLLAERGFPVDSTREQEELLSVEHAGVLDAFRSAHAVQGQAASGRATTEQVRRAMLDYRRVFEEVLDAAAGPQPEPYGGETPARDREERPDQRRA